MADLNWRLQRSCPYTGVAQFKMSVILLLPRISDCLSSVWIRPAVALASIPSDINQPHSFGCSAVLFSAPHVSALFRVRVRVRIPGLRCVAAPKHSAKGLCGYFGRDYSGDL